MSHTKLRRELRNKRRALSPKTQINNNLAIAQTLSNRLEFKKAKHIGFYWPYDGEVDISFLATTDLMSHKQRNWYLPLLSDAIRPWERKRLMFQKFNGVENCINNRYGILEPQYQAATLRSANMLDIVLVPLAGFDSQGNRIGMGQGYYDRTFARIKTLVKKPKLIGLAHSVQRCETLTPASWDIPMDFVITENSLVSTYP